MSKYLKLTIRFYPGQDDDLIAWLEEMRASYGKKGETVKGTLRKGLGTADSGSAVVALDHGSLLADIRQVFESSFASYAFQPTIQAETISQEDAVEERLSRLDLGLSLDPPKPMPKKWGEV